MNKSKNKRKKKTLTRKRTRYINKNNSRKSKVGKNKSHKSKVGKNKSHKSKVTKKNKSRRGGAITTNFFSALSGLRNRPKKTKYKNLVGVYYLSNDPTSLYSSQTPEEKEYIKYLDDKYNNKELYELLKNVLASLQLPNNKKKILDDKGESIRWEKVMVLIYNWDFYWDKCKSDLEKIKLAFPLYILAQCQIFKWDDSEPFDTVTFIEGIFNPSNNNTVEWREKKVASELWNNRKKIEEQLVSLLKNNDKFKPLKEIYDEIYKAFADLKILDENKRYVDEEKNKNIKENVKKALSFLSQVQDNKDGTNQGSVAAAAAEEEEDE